MGRTIDDLYGHGAGHERPPPRRRARAPAPLTLVLHPGALGDVLLAIPALRVIGRRWPDAPLTLAAQPRIGELLTSLGVVSRSVAFDSLGVDALFGDEGAGSFSGWPARCAVDLRRAARVVSWFGSRDATFVRRLKGLVPCAIVAPSVDAHGTVWEHLACSVATGGTDAPACEPIAAPAALVEAGRRELERAGWDGRAPVLVVHPGAGGRAKQWAARGFASVLDGPRASQSMVVIHRGPADAEAVEGLRLLLRQGVPVLEEPSLTTLAGVLRHASAYLGNDSGISHLAAALGVPATVLFIAEHLAWRPWAANADLLTVSTTVVDVADIDRVGRALEARLGMRTRG